MKKYSKGEIAGIILKTLLIAGVVVMIAGAPNTAQLLKYIQPKNKRERERVRSAFRRLEDRDLIVRRGDGDSWKLTPAGTLRAMREDLKTKRIKEQEQWDKKYRLVMFDVPEEKAITRRVLNGALKRLGCVQYQKSVYLTPYPCKEEIDFITKIFDLKGCIKIVVAVEIDDSGKFKKMFHL